jgi:hypothetical protein
VARAPGRAAATWLFQELHTGRIRMFGASANAPYDRRRSPVRLPKREKLLDAALAIETDSPIP